MLNQTSHRLCSLLLRLVCAMSALAAGAVVAQVPADPFNYARVTSFEYNSAGKVTAQIVEPDNPNLCQRTEYGYDTYGNQTSVRILNCTGASGDAVFAERTTTASYAANAVNPAGFFQTSGVNPLTQSGSTLYDNRWGQPTQGTDVNGSVVQAQYDALGRKTLQIENDGNQTRWDYEYCDSSIGSPYASCTTNTPHPLAFRVKVTPLNAAGVQAGPQTITYVDTLGRTVRTENQRPFDGQWFYSEVWFNAAGTVQKKSEPVLVGQSPQYFTYYYYDALNRVVRTEVDDAAASGGKAVYLVSYAASSRTTTNPLGQTETREFNALGQLTRVTDHQGNQLAYKYDAHGNVLETRDALGNGTTTSFDIAGRRVSLNDPDSGQSTFGYNALGLLVRHTDAKGQVTTQQYDLLNRMTARQQPTQNDYWSYDKYADNSTCTKGVGRLCETWSDNGFRRKLFFASGTGYITQQTTTIDAAYSTVFGYDSIGRLATRTYPSGVQVAYNYNSLSALTSVTLASNNQMLWQPLEYNARGQLTKFKHGNNVENTYTYSADVGRLTNVAAGTGNAVLNQSFSYDAANNLTARVDVNLGVNETFGYDSLNRLTAHSLTGPNGFSRSNAFAYNALGNILTQTEAGAYKYAATGSARPHAVTEIVGWAGLLRNPKYTYDANGNLSGVSSDGGHSRSHTFTSFNMPQTMSMDGASAVFGYGTDYGRVKETLARTVNGVVKTRIVYKDHPDNSGGLSYEREVKEDGSVELRHYISGSVVLTTLGATPTTVASIRYWHKDHLGSVVAITDEAGGVVERLAYDPFGKRRALSGAYDGGNVIRSASTDRGFTGHEMLDELGLVHMNGRIYDPSTGRFLSPDPFVESPDNLQSLNRYSYVFNNPMNTIDPTGMWSWRSVFKAVAIAAVTYVTAGAATAAYAGAMAAGTGAAVGTAAYGAAYAAAAGSLTGAAIGGAAGGFVGGLVASKGDVKAAAKGALLGAVSAGLANQAGGVLRAYGTAAGVAAHGVAGCVNAELSGGNCGTGALASMITKGSTLATDSLAATIVTGALTSRITGDDPSTGAVLAGFQYLYNRQAGMWEGASEGAPEPTHQTGPYGRYEPPVWSPQEVNRFWGDVGGATLGTVDLFALRANPVVFGVNFTAGATIAGYNAYRAQADWEGIAERAFVGGMVAGPQTWAMPAKAAAGAGGMMLYRAGAAAAANFAGQNVLNPNAPTNWYSVGAAAATALSFGATMPGNTAVPASTIVNRTIGNKFVSGVIHAVPGTAAGAVAQGEARRLNAESQKKR